MPDGLSREEERRGTRRLMIGGALVAAILGIVVLAWPFLPVQDTGQSQHDPTGVRLSQPEGESVAGKATRAPPAAEYGQTNPATVGRAERITETAEPEASFTEWQRERIRTYVSQHPEQRVESVDFSIAIGAAVPQQTELRNVQGELAEALPSYREDQYILVGNKLVIVEKPTRRIVAIVPVPT